MSTLKSKYISRVIVTTNNVETAELAKSLGAECPFIRSDNLTMNYISLDTVLKDALLHMEESGVFPDLIVKLEETFPFRERGLIDKMIDHVLDEGFDTVIAAKRESGSLWQEDMEVGFTRLDSGDVPRIYKEKSYVGLEGLCCVTHPEFVRQERLFGNKVGLFEVNLPLSSFEVRDEYSRKIAGQLLMRSDIG